MMIRSLGIRHLVCGSCNGCEHEMNALTNAPYDITQYGWDIVAAPAHANVVTVTGPITGVMRMAANATIDGAPNPKVVVAVGDCALNLGPWAGAPDVGMGAVDELGARVEIAGCPPSPEAIIEGLRRASQLL